MLFYDNYNCIHIFTNYTVIVTNVQSTGESKVALKSDSHNRQHGGVHSTACLDSTGLWLIIGKFRGNPLCRFYMLSHYAK